MKQLKVSKSKTNNFKFPKSPTGFPGLDDITTGGLPKNRTTLLLGNAGCGKTIFGMEFLINGINMFNEPGVFMSFEERSEDLIINSQSLGYEINDLLREKKIYLDNLQINRHEVIKNGKYDLGGLFVRLEQAINKVNAKRLVLDSLDALFFGLDAGILRTEFKRLLTWLKEKKITAIITAEIGEGSNSSHGLEEFIADCVIVLNNRVTNQISTRRLKISKYRGSLHGNNEYPFIIDEKGITVFPINNDGLHRQTSSVRISSGITNLDDMLDKKGFYAGSSILISGTAGTGKTSVAASFAYGVCKNKKPCLFCAFEEAPDQIIRNMHSIGVHLEPLIKSGILTFYYSRPTLQNLELHFIAIKQLIHDLQPTVVILDPITNLMTEGPNSDIRSMLTRFVDFLKTQQITVLFTAAITVGSIERNPSDEGISSMVDTWIMVQDIEVEELRIRSLCIMKSRGMPHSHIVRNFNISKKGITLSPIARTVKGELLGAKRKAKENNNLSTHKESNGIKDTLR